MNSLISVVVPCYQVKDYLEHCVWSILNQKFTDYEIILVDDGSTDGTAELCDSLKEKHERIKVVHKKNGGLSDARNAGIEVSRGKYICFIDSDDYIHPDYLECLYNAITSTGSDVAVCSYEMVTETKTDFSILENKTPEILNGRDAVEDLILNNRLMNYAWNKLYKKELFSEVRYPVGKLWEDIGVTYKVFGNSKKVAYIPEKLYYYLQRSGSITSNIKIENVLDQYDLLIKRYYDLKDDFPQLCNALSSQLCECCYNCWSFLQSNTKKLTSEQEKRANICFDYLNKNGRKTLTEWRWSENGKKKIAMYFKYRLLLKLIIKLKRLICK